MISAQPEEFPLEPHRRRGHPAAARRHANGDFDAYWQFHLDREYQRTHASRYKDQFTLAA